MEYGTDFVGLGTFKEPYRFAESINYYMGFRELCAQLGLDPRDRGSIEVAGEIMDIVHTHRPHVFSKRSVAVTELAGEPEPERAYARNAWPTPLSLPVLLDLARRDAITWRRKEDTTPPSFIAGGRAVPLGVEVWVTLHRRGREVVLVVSCGPGVRPEVIRQKRWWFSKPPAVQLYELLCARVP